MPILIRETNIRANLTNDEKEPAPESPVSAATNGVGSDAGLDERIQKHLLRKLKARDER